MTQITLKDLRREIVASEVADKAEADYRTRQVKRMSYSKRLTASVPFVWSFVWLSAILLSSPHTVALFDLISQDLSFGFAGRRFDIPVLLAPLAIEIAIAVLASMREYGVKRRDFFALTIALMIVSIGVNVVGGANKLLTLESGEYAHEVIMYAWLALSMIAGVSVSFVSFYAGTILMQFAKGEIKLETSFDDWYGLIKYDAIRVALYETATARGAGTVTADKYARNTAFMLCKREIVITEDGKLKEKPREVSDALVATDATDATAKATVSRSTSTEFGFAGMTLREPLTAIVAKIDRRDSATVATVSRQVNMSSTQAIADYLRANIDNLPEYKSAGELCELLSGSRDKSRNVQRALKKLREDGFEL